MSIACQISWPIIWGRINLPPGIYKRYVLIKALAFNDGLEVNMYSQFCCKYSKCRLQRPIFFCKSLFIVLRILNYYSILTSKINCQNHLLCIVQVVRLPVTIQGVACKPCSLHLEVKVVDEIYCSWYLGWIVRPHQRHADWTPRGSDTVGVCLIGGCYLDLVNDLEGRRVKKWMSTSNCLRIDMG